MLTSGPLWNFITWMFLSAFHGNIILFGLGIILAFVLLAFVFRIGFPAASLLGVVLLGSMSCAGTICGSDYGFFQRVEFVSMFYVFVSGLVVVSAAGLVRKLRGG